MGLQAFAYVNFEWIGRAFLKFNKNLGGQLQAANIRIHPEVYASVFGMFTVIATAVALLVGIVGAIFVSPFFLLGLIAPLAIFMLYSIYPSFKAHNRAFNLESEVPYAAAYVSVMSTGGISPYKAIQRLRNVKLLPSLSQAAQLMAVDVEAIGMDPVSSMEKMARSLPSPDFKDLLLGYASTLSIGGDVVHYLQRKAYNIFENRARSMKNIGERISVVMESYAVVVILLALGLYILFIISKILPASAGGAFTVGNFVLFAYFLLPMLTAVFLFLLDIYEPRYPTSDWRPYKVLAISFPIGLAFAILTAAPYYFNLPSPLYTPMQAFGKLIGVPIGEQSAVAIALAFIIIFAPPAVVAIKVSREGSEMGTQLVSFLRDMVETRKTGIAPERCIQLLSKRDYGKFSSRLQKIAAKLSWGVSFDSILEDELKSTKNWFVAVNTFLLIDSIDVGGGTPDTLEALASFGEQILILEKEKASALRPLLLIPYIGGMTTLLTATVFLNFVQGLAQMSNFSFSFNQFAMIFLPPVVINTVLAGLVAGKASGEKISAGFLHCTILAAVSVVALAISPMFISGFAPFGS
ncbi:MAG: type II secretion system F family protein [Conexivisphaerales archaeon]